MTGRVHDKLLTLHCQNVRKDIKNSKHSCHHTKSILTFLNTLNGGKTTRFTFSTNIFSMRCEICLFLTSAVKTFIERSQILHINGWKHGRATLPPLLLRSLHCYGFRRKVQRTKNANPPNNPSHVHK